LGVVLASATGSPVNMRNEGVVYRLYSATTSPNSAVDILRRILSQPTQSEIEVARDDPRVVPLPVGNHDGLLAALFTTPGARALSVLDLLDRRTLRPSVMQDAMTKVDALIARLLSYAERKSRHTPGGWLLDLLQDYDAAHPQLPLSANKEKADIAVPMTLDPFFSYSTRRPISDGLVTDKTGLTLSGTRYAALLAFVGAARFLRAQRVAGNLVNLYVPLVSSMKLYQTTTIPLLQSTAHSAQHAIVFRWINYWGLARSMGAAWSGLAYQMLQTQGAQQSISRDCGLLDYSWLAAVEKRAGPAVISHWRWLLGGPRERTAFETDNLVDCLSSRGAATWLAHLRDVALYLHFASRSNAHGYSLKEVREVTTAMVASTTTPLSAVLGRKQGTLRFGCALRQLGKRNPAPLRELVEALDAVRTRDQLVRVLARAVQECAVAGAKSKFKITIPNDNDLRYLLDDIDQYGAASIAGILIILSALYYPYQGDKRFADKPLAPEDPIIKGGEDDRP